MANTVTQALNKKIDDPSLINLLSTVSKILNQSIELIRDLTGREFLDTAEVELVKRRVDIARKVRDYIDEFKKSEEVSRRKFEFHCSQESVYINLDESKFFQIANNLITNALKFTEEEGIIQLKIEDQGDKVLFVFSDNGIGIPNHLQNCLFEKYSEASRKGLRGEPSIGLGLSIVKTIIDWHNGSIRVDSEEGEGTSFYIEIPKE